MEYEWFSKKLLKVVYGTSEVSGLTLEKIKKDENFISEYTIEIDLKLCTLN